MGLLAQARNQPEDALKYFHEALIRQANNLDALRRMAFIYINRQKFKKAIENCDRPSFPRCGAPIFCTPCWATYIRSANAMTRPSREYDEALKLNPRLVAALMGMASVTRAQNQLSVAAGYLDRVLKLVPRNAAVWVARGDIHELMGHRADAMESYQRALAENSDFVPALEQSGLSFDS